MQLYTILSGIQCNHTRSIDSRWFQGMERVGAAARAEMASICSFSIILRFSWGAANFRIVFDRDNNGVAREVDRKC